MSSLGSQGKSWKGLRTAWEGLAEQRRKAGPATLCMDPVVITHRIIPFKGCGLGMAGQLQPPGILSIFQ